MISHFITILQNLYPEATTEDIADVLWLASHLESTYVLNIPDNSNTIIEQSTTAQIMAEERDTEHISEPTSQDSSLPDDQQAYLYDDQNDQYHTDNLQLDISSESAHPKSLNIGRSLRPFMKRTHSYTSWIIDEQATAQQIAEVGLWTPVVRPAPTRWFEIALIIDVSPSMIIWRQTVEEFKRIIEHMGAFRDVRIWNLVEEAKGQHKLWIQAYTNDTNSPQQVRNPSELIDPSGKRIIIIITDCVSSYWRNGAVAQTIKTWGKSCLVTIAQVLPQRLWRRTALAYATPARLNIPFSGASNKVLTINSQKYLFDQLPSHGIKVPIVLLEPEALIPWARAITGMESTSIPGYVLNAETIEEERESFEIGEGNDVILSAEMRVRRFRALASPLARRLAGLVAAAPVNLSIIRFIQQTMLPNSQQVHFAEFFLGGLLQEIASDESVGSPNNIQYDFIEGVRDILLQSVPVNESVHVLIKVSDFIEENLGLPLNFRTLLFNPTSKIGFSINQKNKPFTYVATKVLHKLGGDYSLLAAHLEEKMRPAQEQTRVNAKSKITYHQQVSYCGKPHCRKCREGRGHGPYWYAYQTVEGKTTRTYVGRNLPPDVQVLVEGQRETPVPLHEQEQEQELIRIYVLGQFRLERRSSRTTSEWQTVTDSAWQHQRVRALLGCLVSSTGRKLGRKQIMDALWPDLDLETAASRLDRAVYSLRQLFEPSRNRPATSPFLLTEREQLVLADQSQVWVDADAFEHLLAQARETDDLGKQESLLDEAATLYGGDFLPEERRVEWALGRRESLQRSWIGLLLDLARLRIDRNALTSAIEPLDRLLSVDPTNEAAVQRLMKLLYELGRRGEALRVYKRLAQVLQQEYRIAPQPETRAIYEALRSGGTSPSVPASSTAIQIGRAHQSPLVGREEELGVLRNMVLTTEHSARFRLSQRKTLATTFDSTQRRAQCMLLMGDVGIGKTRLAEEVSRDAKRRNWAVAWSRVYAQEESIPYRLWTEVLRKAMAQGVWQHQELSRRPLVFQPLCTLLPELYDYLPPVSFSTPQSPEQEQLNLWMAAHALLTLISESTPLLIALDDLQWADGSSCELLAYLARRIYGHSIVIVGTCRDNELPPNHPLRPLLTDLQREHAVETLPLLPLSNEQISTLVLHISSHVVSRLSEQLVQHICTRAAGNPFFAEELTRNIIQRVESFGPSSLLVTLDRETDLPETIKAVLDLRLNRLSSDCLRLLNKAAVLGNSFEFPVINEMEVMTPGANEDVVLDLLEEALNLGILTEEGGGTYITYQFWHPLLVEHLYEKLSAARRASLHRRAANILQQTYQGREEEGAPTILHHLIRGGADEQKIARFAALAKRPHYTYLISYSDKDLGFAEKLYNDLQSSGIRCWHASEDMKFGDHYYQRGEKSIRSYDKLILILSEQAVQSTWIEHEVVAAREKEDHEERPVLFPICLDETVMNTTKAWVADVRRCWHISDFVQWKDHDAYQVAFQSLLRELKAEYKQR